MSKKASKIRILVIQMMMLLLIWRASATATSAPRLLRSSYYNPTFISAVVPLQQRQSMALAVRQLLRSSSSTSNSEQDALSSSSSPPLCREEIMKAKVEKIQRSQAHKELLLHKMKEKVKRYRSTRDQRDRALSEERKAELKRQQEQADAWMKEVYELDATDEWPLPPRLRLVIDLGYDSSTSQFASLSRQLGCAMGLIRKSTSIDTIPSIHFTSAQGPVMESLAKNGGSAWLVHLHEKSVFEVFPTDSLIYLTPDSSSVLEEIDPSKLYVVGGLVDRVVLRRMSYGRAANHGVATARLPLKEFFKKTPNGQKYISSQCLALDRVIKVMMKYYECQDWEVTLREAFPKAYDDEHKGSQ